MKHIEIMNYFREIIEGLNNKIIDKLKKRRRYMKTRTLRKDLK